MFLFGKKKEVEENNEIISNNNDFNNDDLIFGSFITGIKEIPYNTLILLVNDLPLNSINIIYNTSGIENDNNTFVLPLSNIKNISFTPRVTMQNQPKKPENNETKSILLSAVVFGGNPLIQVLGNNMFNKMFNTMSNNYNKINFNEYFEINIDAVINGENTRLIINTDNSPETFIKQIPIQ